MPYKSEKLIKLAGTSQDKRRKLSDEQKDEIVSLKGTISTRECAKRYDISRRTIQFLWDPDKVKANLQRRMERGGSKIYYSKEKNREYIKLHRHYKQEIYLKLKEKKTMKLFDERIQNHLLNGGEIKRNDDEFLFNLRHIKLIDDELCFTDGKNENYKLNRGDLIADDWEIVEPEYNWDKIIKDKVLCVFSSNYKTEYYIVGYLEKIESDGNFKLFDGLDYPYCKPFNSADYNIVKDLKEYEK